VNSDAQVQFSRISKIFKVPQQQLDGGSFEKTNIKHCKIICPLEPDTGSGKMKINVEFNSTLDQQVLMTQKCNRCIRDLQTNIIRRKYGSKNQFKRIRKKCRERTKGKTGVSHSLGKKQPLSFIELPHQSHMVL